MGSYVSSEVLVRAKVKQNLPLQCSHARRSLLELRRLQFRSIGTEYDTLQACASRDHSHLLVSAVLKPGCTKSGLVVRTQTICEKVIPRAISQRLCTAEIPHHV